MDVPHGTGRLAHLCTAHFRPYKTCTDRLIVQTFWQDIKKKTEGKKEIVDLRPLNGGFKIFKQGGRDIDMACDATVCPPSVVLVLFLHTSSPRQKLATWAPGLWLDTP